MFLLNNNVSFQYPVLFQKAPKDPKKMESIDTAFSLLDKFLEGQDFVAGKNLTLADLSIVVTVATYEVIFLKLPILPIIAMNCVR